MKDKNGKRPLTPEEKKLWRFVTRDAAPLHADKDMDETSPSPFQGEGSEHDERMGVMLSDKRNNPHLNPPPKRGRKSETLLPGNYAGIDRRTAEKFRRGDWPIDATLDLHGMRQREAREALYGFIAAQYRRNARCLLVITGKGRAEGSGVLKELLPQWLTDADLRPMLLAVDAARPRHGGSGAWYVLLRRKR